jgi:hypothetical protein
MPRHNRVPNVLVVCRAFLVMASIPVYDAFLLDYPLHSSRMPSQGVMSAFDVWDFLPPGHHKHYELTLAATQDANASMN